MYKYLIVAALASGLGHAAYADEPPILEEPVRGAGEAASQQDTRSRDRDV